jgi:hypothetical protein
VTALAAELHGVQVFDGSVADLAADDRIGARHHGKEYGCAAKSRAAIRQCGKLAGNSPLS